MLKRLIDMLVGALALAVALAPIPAAAQAKASVPLLLCPAGCGPTEGDTILMVQMIKENAPVTLLPQETPGFAGIIIGQLAARGLIAAKTQ